MKKMLIVYFLLHISLLLCGQESLSDSTSVADSTGVSYINMPNAFSPNDDGWNDVYRVKSSRGIVEFRAIIFNRWGQRLYEWNDVNGSWDGTYGGRAVKDGTYFVLVTAKGSDGVTHKIRKDVNVVRGVINGENRE